MSSRTKKKTKAIASYQPSLINDCTKVRKTKVNQTNTATQEPCSANQL